MHGWSVVFTTTSLQIFFQNACNGVSQSVVSAVDKASFLANKNVVVGVIFATNAFLGYVGNG